MPLRVSRYSSVLTLSHRCDSLGHGSLPHLDDDRTFIQPILPSTHRLARLRQAVLSPSLRSSFRLRCHVSDSRRYLNHLETDPHVLFHSCAFFVSRHSDKTNERYWHIVIPASIGIIGFIIAMSTQNCESPDSRSVKQTPNKADETFSQTVGARYFALFLQAQSYSGFVCFLAWVSGT